MAASASLHQEGYDDVHFTTQVPDELRCIVCQVVLRDPVQVMSCGHRFCSNCFEKIKIHAQQTKVDLMCPVDRDVVPLSLVFPDKAAARTIGNLNVQCANHGRGCSWVGELRDMKNHKDQCQFEVVDRMNAQSMSNGRDEKLYAAVEQLMTRMQNCENDLLVKDKDILNLKLTVGELTEDSKVKNQEIGILKLANLALKTETTAKDEEIKLLRESISEFQKNLKCAQESSNQHGLDINNLQLKSIEMEEEVENLKESHALINQPYDVDDISAVMENIEESLKESSQHIENLENVMFAHQQLQQSAREIQYRWVMPDYLQMFGKDVFSPIFRTKICGFSFQLQVMWSGTDKGKLGIYLLKHRGNTPHSSLGEFDHEYTLAFHGKNGINKSYTVTHSDLAKFKDRFVIKEGKDVAETGVGWPILNAPYDDFIMNDSLIISCTIHL